MPAWHGWCEGVAKGCIPVGTCRHACHALLTVWIGATRVINHRGCNHELSGFGGKASLRIEDSSTWLVAFTPLICTPGPGLASPPVNLDEAKLDGEQTCLLPSRFVIRSGPIWTEFSTCSGDPGQTLSRLAKLGSANDRVDGTVAALRVD